MNGTIPQLFAATIRDNPSVVAQYIKDANGDFHPRTYRELADEVRACAHGLSRLGIQRGDHVGLISENRAEWLVADLATLSLGAVDVPRGNDSVADEIAYILGFAECRLVVVEDRDQLDKIARKLDELPKIETIVVFDEAFTPDSLQPEVAEGLSAIEILPFREVIALGHDDIHSGSTLDLDAEIAQGDEGDVATIIFTSGTTGTPKGVMLTHRNFVHQVRSVPAVMEIRPGDIWLAVLPVWHSFERLAQYVAIGSTSGLAYSKPIGQVMLADLSAVRPQWMASVPRIWEAIRAGIARNAQSQGAVKFALFRFFTWVGSAHRWATDMVAGRIPDFRRRLRGLDAIAAIVPLLLLSPFKVLGNALVFGKIKKRLGGRFVAGVSGGGALPASVDSFFGAAGIALLEGYGLTETGPGLCFRSQFQPVLGTVGQPIAETEIEIRDERGTVLSPGEQGIVFARGPQVMKGYYKRPDETAAMIDDERWLNTGDLGVLTHRGELKITGRAKDTIVLLGGENVEPLPIEQKLRESALIEQAVVVGQDQKFLSALIVPNEEALRAALGAMQATLRDLVQSEPAQALIKRSIDTLVSAKNGFRGFEQIFRFALVPEVFQVGRELSAKQEVKRHTVAQLYADTIKKLFS